MKTRWLAFSICATVAAGLLFGGMKIYVLVSRPLANAGAARPTTALRSDLPSVRGDTTSTILSPASVPASESSRFHLVGVIAPGDPNSGSQRLALIAIDGKPAQVFRVGDVLDSDRVLQAIQANSISVGPRGGATLISLEIAAPGMATTQPGPSPNISTRHAQNPSINSAQGSAPNVLLNNPADMAPADASGLGSLPSR
jgi:hypothetical protein